MAGLSTIEHETAAADGLLALPLDGRRSHMHYTHVHTNSATEVQPSQISRAAFWEHLVRCYREAYPKAESETGSILGQCCKGVSGSAPSEINVPS